MWCVWLFFPHHSYYNDGSYGKDEEAASAQCSEWLADNRKKALLADVGVGTIDQGLMAVLPSKHQSLRLLGLSRNVLIVDEVHAYDPHMHTLLCTLLRFHAALGGSAILLSATLPIKHRQELMNSFSQGLEGKREKLNDNSYPLITHSTANSIIETPLQIREGTQHKVALEFFDDISIVERYLVKAAENGGCACWIRNTVDDAVDAYNSLSSKLGSENKACNKRRDRNIKNRNALQEIYLNLYPVNISGSIVVFQVVLQKCITLMRGAFFLVELKTYRFWLG